METEPQRAFKHGNAHFIELRQIVKKFPCPAGSLAALRDINLHVDRGEFIAIIGRSGSGKSTLVNMLTGIDRPTSGEVYVGDTAVHRLGESKMARWRGRNTGIVFQFFQLLPMLSLAENVMLPMDFGRMYPGRQRRERALQLLDLVGLSDHADKLPMAVSGGQQQRAAIARALANDPPVILADEPTGNLDSQMAESVFGLFESLAKQGRAVIVVTHDDDLAQRVHRTVILSDGQIVDEYRCAEHH